MTKKRKISAKIVADSIDPRGNRITTFVLTYPRFIHAELLTHRLFSRNAASSRAIPFKKMVEDVENDPFIPIAWQKDHKGMQGAEYFTIEDDKQLLTSGKYYSTLDKLEERWLTARDKAVQFATDLNAVGLTKQLCNRLLEPFQWYTCLVTTTEFDNFYELRCPKFINKHENGEDISFSRKDFIKKLQERYPTNWEMELKDFFGIENNTEEEWFSLSNSGAEIHIQALAETMWDARNESLPNQLKAGEWHIPFGDRIVEDDLLPILYKVNAAPGEMAFQKVKIATSRCARLSYMTFDGEIDYEKDIKLHYQLLESKHYSPFEHCCRVMSDKEYYSFIKGEVPTLNDEDGILNYEYYAYSHGRMDINGYKWINFDGENPKNGNRFGWCNNIKGFIQYRYLLENGNS